jgi:hypothetical protein
VLLIEAKSDVAELKSPGTTAEGDRLKLIKDAYGWCRMTSECRRTLRGMRATTS